MYKLLIIIITLYLSGCAWVCDFPRTLWGSSIRVLEQRRDQATAQTADCSADQAFDLVLDMTVPFGKKRGATDDAADNPLQDLDDDSEAVMLFQQNRRRRTIVVMGVPGSVDTTEVGVFFRPVSDAQAMIEVVSLSSRAQETMAKMIFERVADQCRTGM